MMKVTAETLELAFKGFQTVFNDAFKGAASQAETVAMTVKSTTTEENYAWLGQFPSLREWIGDRVIKELSAHGFTLTNRKFESTVSVKRDDFEDAKFGIYKPMFAEMGRVAANHPDTLLFALLQSGFTGACYDGLPFFSASHPVSGAIGDPRVQSNLQVAVDGQGAPLPAANQKPAWYLMDCSRAIKPLIWQERISYDFHALIDVNSPRVFMTDEFLYGIRARANAGFGLWQLAFGSTASLNSANYAAARAAMMTRVGDEEQLLGIMPTHLIVPPSLEIEARALLKAAQVEGTSNVWADSATLVVSPWLR